MESDDKPSTELTHSDPSAPLETLVEHEKELARDPDGEVADQSANPERDVTQSESPKPLPPPETDRAEAVDEVEQALNHAKAMIEGPGGDVGMEINVRNVFLEGLPLLPLAVDALGRLWALDHHENKLRLVGRVSK